MQLKTKLVFLVLVTLGLMPLSAAGYEEEFGLRARKIINYVADDYKWDASGWYNCSPSDYGKYNWPIVVATLHKYGVNNPKGNQYLGHFNTGSCILNRFHFNLMGESYIFTRFWEAPSVKANVKAYLTAAWNRSDSYNLFTAEGTENHLAMTRCPAYLYAQIARDSFPADFPDAAQKMAELKQWILDWGKMLYSSGPGEWNSSTYASYNISSWLALYDGATDEDVRDVARAVLDYYATEMALHYTQGITGGYESRNGTGYESVVTYGDYLGWLWFGDSPRKITFNTGSQNNEAATAVYAAVSTYRPPQAVVKLASKYKIKNAMFYNSKGEYLLNNPSSIKQTFYVGETFTLGASYLPYGGFTGGDGQFQTWKWVGKVAADTSITTRTANLIVGYGSKEWNKARGRMPWDQVVHHKNVLIQMTRVPVNFTAIKNDISARITDWKTSWSTDFMKRFPSDTKPNPVNMSTDVLDANFSYMAVWKKNAAVSYVISNNIAFFTLDSNFVAIRSLVQTSPTVSTATENYGIKDAAPAGQVCGLILETASKREYPSLTAFQNAVLSTTSLMNPQPGSGQFSYTNLNGETIEVQYQRSGTFTEPLYDWGYGVSSPQMAQKSPPYTQPQWPTGEGHGRIASWRVNQSEVNLSNSWPVLNGPNVLLSNQLLSLYPDEEFAYSVDFSGSLPEFNRTLTTIHLIKDTEMALEVFPNPATELVFVDISSSWLGSMSIELLDLKGQSVYFINQQKTQVKQQFKIPLPRKYKGLYMLKVVAGKNSTTQKVQIY